LVEDLGGVPMMVKRAKYVDTLIIQAEAKTTMMQKVTASSLSWALIAFIGFMAVAAWEAIKVSIRSKV